MNLTIRTDSGVEVTQPTEKWVMATLIALSSEAPGTFAKVIDLVDTKIDAYATIPESVQRSLKR